MSSSKHNNFVIRGLFPNFFSGMWVSHTYSSLLQTMLNEGCEVTSTVLAKERRFTSSAIQSVFPLFIYKHLSSLLKSPDYWILKKYPRQFKPGDIAYLWLSNSLALYEQLHAKNAFVVKEMINCTQFMRRVELNKAYSALGLPGMVSITDEEIEKEKSELLGSDAVFCSSPLVRQSVIDHGFPAENCIEEGYGWDPARLSGNKLALPAVEGFSLVFVGTVDIRKGAPWLLQAWVNAGVKGRLILAGPIDRYIKDNYAAILGRDDVITLGYVKDVGAVYRSADAFVLPSWEEGAPLSTLEAMACGLPCIVTPMATANAVSEPEGSGFVIPPGDVEQLTEKIRQLANDPDLRVQMAEKALQRSGDFTWDKVGHRRLEALIQQREKWTVKTQ